MYFLLETRTIQGYGRMIAVGKKVLRHCLQTILFTFLWIFQIAKFVIMSASGISLYGVCGSKTLTSNYPTSPEYAVYILFTSLEFCSSGVVCLKSRISSRIYFFIIKSTNFHSLDFQISSPLKLFVTGSFGERI